jgi:cell wall-associated NlpC family hydrolase
MVKFDDLIGIPYKRGGRGPHVYDCYGLVMEMHRRAGGLELKDYASPEKAHEVTALFASEVRLWTPCEPSAGAVPYVVIVLPSGLVWTHCGYMLDDNRMIHTWEKSGGVCVERVDTWKRRIKGFYRYVG